MSGGDFGDLGPLFLPLKFDFCFVILYNYRMKEKPSTKEQLVYYMLQHISLGTYDNKFLTSLHDNLVSRKNPITSNQADLLTKITLRYFRQFKKQELDATELSLLPWTTQPVLSSPQYTNAFCAVEDNNIIIRSPYNAGFITDIKKMPVMSGWDRDTKTWAMPYCEITAKHSIDCVMKHYSVVNFCPILTEVIDSFAKYETAKYWDPTYKNVNGVYMIVGITKQIYDNLGDAVLDASPASLALLTSLGVLISDEIIIESKELLKDVPYSNELVNFATTTSSSIVDTERVTELAGWLKEINSDYVVIVDAYKEQAKNKTKNLHMLLTDMGINTKLTSRSEREAIDLSQYKLPVVVNSSMWGMGSFSRIAKCKIVFLGNSKPIEIK